MFKLAGPDRAALQRQLIEWLKTADTGITQGSDQWLKDKVYTVGGSSMGTILDINQHQSLRDLVAQRVGLNEFRGSPLTRWGNLFEDIIKQYVEFDLNTTIHGEELYIKDERYPNVAYSPDGLAIIDTSRLYQRERAPIAPYECAMLEFKAPYNRVPGKSPPCYYIPQPLMGMEVTPAVTSLFIEAVFRPITFEQFDTNPGHVDLGPKRVNFPPVAIGAIGLYAKELNGKLLTALDKYDLIGKPPECATKDLGKMNKRIFDSLLMEFNERIEAGSELIIPIAENIAKTYPDAERWLSEHPDHTNFTQAQLSAKLNEYTDKHEQYCRNAGYINVGVLAWKLHRIEYHWIERQPGFLDEHNQKINDVIDMVKKLMSLPMESRKEELEKMFSMTYEESSADDTDFILGL